jgi:hypothetical protein
MQGIQKAQNNLDKEIKIEIHISQFQNILRKLN